MKWDSTDLRVGLLVFVFAIISVVTLIWASQLWGGRNIGPLYTDVVDVQGIAEESQVILNGFAVGRVSEVRPRVAENGALLFRVRMNIMWRLDNGAEMPLKQGLRARVVPAALDIGRGSIVLEMDGTPGATALKPGDVVPSSTSTGTTNRMQLVVDSVGRDMRLVIAEVDKLVQALSVTVATATATMKTANTMIASVNQDLPAMMTSAKANLASADSLIRGLHQVTPATIATLDSVRLLLGDSRVAIARATEFLDNNEPQLASTIANLDQASAVLNNLLKEVSRRPIKALTGVRPPDLTSNGDVKQAGTNGKAPKP
jgi:ABC-type transporter Mla subunit MlaD